MLAPVSGTPPPTNVFTLSLFPLRQQRRLFFLLPILVLILLAGYAAAGTAFPHYPVIKDNVRFWESIYSRYSTNTALVHDSNDLSIIYEVIPIFDHRLPGASKINKPILKGIKQKYTRILKNIAKGQRAGSADEKRVAKMFKNKSRKQIQEAARSVRVQIGQKGRFIEGVIRSGAYMDEIKKIFRREGLPEELAYLPHVESSFNLKAYSKFGASGIWQFTRSTGKQFLKINYEIDERQDPITASRAAARLLKKNYQRLGSWPLALTAYNYGRAGMARALKKHGSYEKIFSRYQQGRFKFASRNFYSEFLAALAVAKGFEKDPAIKKHTPMKVYTLTLPAYIPISSVSTHFNVSVASIQKLNPALRPPVLQEKKYIPKGYRLRLPYNKTIRKLAKNIPRSLYHSKQKPTKFYRVKAGDTAGQIARRHNISLKALMKANHLDKRASVFIGQNLRIPGTGGNTQKNRRIASISAASRKRHPAHTPEKTVVAATENNGLPVLRDNKKREAQWKSVQKARSVVLGELSVSGISGSGSSKQGSITVQPEESWELLADWLRTNAKELRKLNRISVGHALRPDQKIKIPLNHVSQSGFEEKRFTFHLEIEEDFYNAYKVTGVTTYKVVPGDTIWEICKEKFDLPFWLLKKYNTTLDFNTLRPSQLLTIPKVKER